MLGPGAVTEREEKESGGSIIDHDVMQNERGGVLGPLCVLKGVMNVPFLHTLEEVARE